MRPLCCLLVLWAALASPRGGPSPSPVRHGLERGAGSGQGPGSARGGALLLSLLAGRGSTLRGGGVGSVNIRDERTSEREFRPQSAIKWDSKYPRMDLINGTYVPYFKRKQDTRPVLYPIGVVDDLNRAEQKGDLNAMARLWKYALTHPQMDWVWYGMDKPADYNEEEDLRRGREVAELLPEKFPWEDAAFEEAKAKRKAALDEAMKNEPERCAFLLRQLEHIDDNNTVPFEMASPEEQVYACAEYGYSEKLREVVEQTGQDVNAVAVRIDEAGWTPLHAAAHAGFPETIVTLVELGANVNQQADDGSTALHLAAKSAHEDCIITLVNAGVNPLVKDGNEKMAFDVAQDLGHVSVAERLYQLMDAR